MLLMVQKLKPMKGRQGGVELEGGVGGVRGYLEVGGKARGHRTPKIANRVLGGLRAECKHAPPHTHTPQRKGEYNSLVGNE